MLTFCFLFTKIFDRFKCSLTQREIFITEKKMNFVFISIKTNRNIFPFIVGKMVLSCRFYKEKYPEVEDVVMVNVRSIAEMGAYVHLLEYNNIEGMILLSELSRRRIRSINKLIRVGKTEPVVVIRVDKEKGKVYKSFMHEIILKLF